MKFNRSAAAVVLSASLVLAACGGSDEAETSVAPVSPSITVGGAADPLSQLLSSMWAQSLTEAGYRVARKDPLPDRSAVYSALEGGTLQLAPELSSTFLQFLADRAGDEVDARNIDTQIQELAARLPESLVTADPVAADAAIVLACTAGAVADNELSSIADAATDITALRIAAVPGTDLEKIGEVYEVDLTGVPTIDAADVGAQIQGGAFDCVFVSAVNPAIVTAGLLPLADERGVLAVDAPLPIAASATATPDVTALLAQLNASLTTEVLRALLVKLEDPANSPNSVAKGYLATFSQQSGAQQPQGG